MAKFKATVEQIKHLQAVATNASNPVGMGFLHYDGRKEFTAADFPDTVVKYGTDYVQGRMVKCRPRLLDADKEIYELDEPRYDYQSWADVYPTTKDLIEAAGLQVIEETQPEVQAQE